MHIIYHFKTQLSFTDHPEMVSATLYRNPWQCDARLCWLREADRDGWLRLIAWVPDYALNCRNYPGVPWTEVDLGCEETN